jgi:DNA invertase Pin-like site-specific DNA recombinase
MIERMPWGDSKPRRCAVYTRLATTVGADPPQATHGAQRDPCVAYVRSRPGWSVYGYYQDHLVSGASMNRPALQRLLADVVAGHVDVVVVHQVDRLSRLYLDFATIMAELLFHGAGLVSVSDGLSTLEPAGQRVLSMMLSFAPLEREVLGTVIASRRGLRGAEIGGAPDEAA